MSATVVVLTLLAILLLTSAGYLFGVRAGRAARDGLRSRLDAAEKRAEDAMSVLVERERMERELGWLDEDTTARSELPVLLERIARKVGFTTVLLSDEMGLPVASNRETDADTIAGTSSMLLTLADRICASGRPATLGAVLRDEQNQVTIHRIFKIGEERYVLTAVADGLAISPEALDPVLTRLRRLLDADLTSSLRPRRAPSSVRLTPSAGR